MGTTNAAVWKIALTAASSKGAILGGALLVLSSSLLACSASEESLPNDGHPAEDTPAPAPVANAPPADDTPTDVGGDVSPPKDAPPAAGPRCDVQKPFGQPVAIAGLPKNATHLYVSPDELTIYYDTGWGTGNADLWTATRPNRTAPFASAQALSELNTPAYDYRPSISADGLTIHFSRDTGANQPGGGIFEATRPTINARFGTPTVLPGIEEHQGARVRGCLRQSGRGGSSRDPQ